MRRSLQPGRRFPWTGCLLVALAGPAAAEPPDPPEPARRQAASAPPPVATPATGQERAAAPRKNSAAQMVRDGTFLPQTVSARIGDQYVSAMALGGYDSASGEGGRLNAVVEGALFNRLALRVSADYTSGHGDPQFSAGLRLGVLRQELHHIDLGFVALYKNQGFTESRGEIELMLSVARRWSRLALFGNVVYGQGFEVRERDGELRLALLYQVHDRINVGLDARGRFDLGEAEGPLIGKSDHPFDLVAGPLAAVTVGPVAFLANAGVHAILFDQGGQDVVSVGAVALAGLGAAY